MLSSSYAGDRLGIGVFSLDLCTAKAKILAVRVRVADQIMEYHAMQHVGVVLCLLTGMPRQQMQACPGRGPAVAFVLVLRPYFQSLTEVFLVQSMHATVGVPNAVIALDQQIRQVFFGVADLDACHGDAHERGEPHAEQFRCGRCPRTRG